jgi:hypothetical protein
MRIATFNIRNTTDRYDERRPLIVAAIANMAVDVLGLQEVCFDDDNDGTGSQSALAAAACGPSFRHLDARTPSKFPAPATDPTFNLDGNSIVYDSSKFSVVSHEVLEVGSRGAML